jgi:hypothetical protein
MLKSIDDVMIPLSEGFRVAMSIPPHRKEREQ